MNLLDVSYQTFIHVRRFPFNRCEGEEPGTVHEWEHERYRFPAEIFQVW